MANRVRSLYIAHRRRHESATTGKPSTYGASQAAMSYWDGGRNSKGTKRKSVWMRIAEVVLQSGVEPEHLVAGVFAVAPPGQPPAPTVLGSADALELARDYQKDIPAAVMIDVESERRAAETRYAELGILGWPEDRMWRCVITTTTGLSALYRVCLAESVGQAAVAKPWHEVAALQYLGRQREYDAALGDLIPAWFRAEAERVQREVLRVV
jgi:hypothetical protein